MEAPGSGSVPTAKRRRLVPRPPPVPLEVAGARGPYMPPLCIKSKNPSAKCYLNSWMDFRPLVRA
uniref:Uncharacterized protein n=1 Tax=Oryza sativa subsp. japonica TaxID=39947 RepID=Q6K361_ORYSJ|nr:hypothetical protein [Oryza sativa Japonica Group]